MTRLLTLLLITLFSLNSHAQLAALDGARPLTEQEEDESKSYIHQGVFNEKVQELCQQKNDETNSGKASNKQTADYCNNEGAFRAGSGWSTLEQMMPAVTKAYASFGPLTSKLGAGSQSGIKFYTQDKTEIIETKNEAGEVTATEEVTHKNKDREYDTKTDICQYIPMATEVGAQALQMTNNQNTAQNYENTEANSQQAAAFYAMSEMHKTKKRASTIQAAGWGSTSACYLAYVASGAALDVKMGIKIGASALIGTFYGIKAKKHKEKEEAFITMAESLPGAGDCNPHTKTSCFCAHESSYSVDPTNYQKYCVPQGYTYSPNSFSTGCMDKSGKSDPACSCKKKGTCMASTLMNSGFKVGLNPVAMKGALDGVSYFDNGFGSDNLLAQANKTNAMAFKALKKYQPQGKAPKLNKDQTKIAKLLNKNGIPTGLAMQMAATNNTADAEVLKNLAASLNNNSFKPRSYSKAKPKNKFKKGGSVAKSSRGSSYSSRTSRTKSAKTGTQIMDFAAQASIEAEIEKDSSKGIFDIITNRYKMRAWREFKDDVLEKPEATQ